MLIQMLFIAKNGLVQFVEANRGILLTEICLITLVTAFGITVFILQIKRLGERRSSDKQERRRQT